MLKAKKTASAVAEQRAGTGEIEQVQEKDMPMGMVGSRAAAPLPSDGENGMMHTGTEEATEGEGTLSVSPVLSARGQRRRGENGEGQVLLLEGDGTQLTDENGQLLYEEPGWHLLCSQDGYAHCDDDGNHCFDEVDEDQLAMMTQSVHRKEPVTAAQMDSVIEQNQLLRMELDQSLLAHQNDAERMQETMKQKDMQAQSDFRAMMAEFEQKKAEWVEK